MSLEDQYDAWVRGLMGGKKYATTSKQAEEASDAVQQMQASLDALTAAQKRQSAAGSALDAVQKAGAATAESVRKMSSELTRSLHQDGLLGGTTAAPTAEPKNADKPVNTDFSGAADKIKAQVLGQDAFVSALVKAFRRPFVMGTAGDTGRARNLMLLCGPNGTGRHYALTCAVEELADRGILRSAAIERMDLSLYPGPAQEKLFLQDLYAALQSDAEVLAFDHYEGCAANYLNMLSTLAIEGTLSLSSRYVLQRGILVDVGTALAPGAIGELTAGGKYFVFFSNKDEAALADTFGARFVDALAGDVCRTQAFTPEALAAVAARELNWLAQRVRKQCGLALSMGADVRDLLAAQSTYNYGALEEDGTVNANLSHQAYSCLIAGDAYEPVCDGYAKAVKMVCDLLEIPCALASSDTHMWNNIKMDDGDWYNLDLTWDDANDQAISYDYFLIGSQTVVDGQAFSRQPDHVEENPWQESSDLNHVNFGYPVKNQKAYQLVEGGYDPLRFPDVKRSAWYYDYVESAADMGLFSGDERGFFNPQKDITRAELSKCSTTPWPLRTTSPPAPALRTSKRGTGSTPLCAGQRSWAWSPATRTGASIPAASSAGRRCAWC